MSDIRWTPIEMLRLADKRREGMTLQQLADEYGVTRERIRQVLDCVNVRGRPFFTQTHYRRWAQAIHVAARCAQIEAADAGPDHPDFPHGTSKGYAHGCKCDECRRVNRERTYRTIGFTPKRPRPEWQKPLAEKIRQAKARR